MTRLSGVWLGVICRVSKNPPPGSLGGGPRGLPPRELDDWGLAGGWGLVGGWGAESKLLGGWGAGGWDRGLMRRELGAGGWDGGYRMAATVASPLTFT